MGADVRSRAIEDHSVAGSGNLAVKRGSSSLHPFGKQQANIEPCLNVSPGMMTETWCTGYGKVTAS
jgi:hypothetical protein